MRRFTEHVIFRETASYFLSSSVSSLVTSPKLYRLVNCVNGGSLPLADVGVENGMAIAMVWTVLREDLLFAEDGSPRPVHFTNAFVEDAGHDWSTSRGAFRFFGHSSPQGADVRLLIVLRPEAPDVSLMTPGQHAFSATYDPARPGIGFPPQETFSIGVFKTEAKSRGGAKRGPVIYRIVVPLKRRDDGFLRAQEVCKLLDSGRVPAKKSEKIAPK